LTHAGLAPAAATASLASLLTAHAVSAAPAGLASAAASVAATLGAATAGSASFTIAKGALAMMTWTKIKAVAAIIAVATVVGTGAVVTVNRGLVRAQERAAVVPTVQPNIAQLRAKAATRVEAAKKVVDTLEQVTSLGQEPLTASVVEIRGAAHLGRYQLADAEYLLAKAQGGQ
jgi:hypothetical protein